MNRTAVLAGIGSYLPPRVVTNAEIADRVGSSDEWIRTRTGVERRHQAAPGTTTSDLAIAAGRQALRSAGDPGVDMVVVATTTPDQPCPATAPTVASGLGLAGAAAFDLAAVCSGFVYGLSVASGLIAAGIADGVLVIGAEIFSSILNPGDRATSVIFGDGAGAAVLRAGQAGQAGAVGPFHLASDGEGRDLITVRAGGTRERLSVTSLPSEARYFAMAGRKVFWRAVQCMADSAAAVLATAGWKPSDVDWLVCHQANARILDQLSRTLDIGPERRVSNIGLVGNTAGASIPIALDHAHRDGRLRPGNRILLTAFGGGLTWGSAAMTWPALSYDPQPQLPHDKQEADMATTYDKVVDLLVSRFQVDPAKIQPGATFEQLEMDSLFLVEFLLTVESDFGVQVSEDSATPHDTIEKAVQLIDDQLAAAARP